ncbi:penicillin-binding protein 2 [Stakelama sediminis]|uniref:Cell division protein FtsI (Penicillin-binding protein 3) n=1 Tax=Stakelama sediminis TaxID=463200 RepID=A0A840YUW8_9SPHN|nr:penicillin-binding protein 2 [Stakelama sediminis]MBB5717382.1 cell division protein FtsI (penicillin-binding protein 3) [Stakelama sediminis]
MIVLVSPSERADRQTLVTTAHMRLMVLLLLFLAGAVLILGRLTQLAFSAEPYHSGAIDGRYVPARADILDRNGAPLARTIDGWSIGVHPDKVIGDKQQLAQELANVLPAHDAAWYYRKLNLDVPFTYLARRALPETVERVNAIGEPGIAFGREPERLYPQSTLAAHVLGFVGADGHGLRGIERSLDARLTDPDKRADPVELSIDSRVQAAMESELSSAMAEFKAEGAAGIVLDVHTGEVIAMSSLPTFNPNDIKHATQAELRNNVTQARYELGSVFKPLAMAQAIDTGTVTSMARRFDATKPLKVGRFTIHDDPGDEQRRWLNIPETLIYSSNIATARIADLMGEDKMKQLFHKLHFDQESQIQIEEKMPPLWPTYWGRTTTMTTAFGHGIAITPIQLATAYAALVNGGIWRPATLLKVAPGHAAKGQRVFSQATSDRMRQLLRLVVLDGTGRKAAAPGYRVGGKTGTAEIANNGRYEKHSNVSTFAGVFPMDNPRYVVIATLVAPVGNASTYGFTTAAWTAGPVASHVITRVGSMLGVTPSMHRDIDVSDLTPLLWHRPGSTDGASETKVASTQ